MLLYLTGRDTGRPFLFLYQHRFPELHGGFYVGDWCRDASSSGSLASQQAKQT